MKIILSIILRQIEMDKFTESTTSYIQACGPSRFQHRVMDENLQAAQAQGANHQRKEALDHLSMVMIIVTKLFR